MHPYSQIFGAHEQLVWKQTAEIIWKYPTEIQIVQIHMNLSVKIKWSQCMFGSDGWALFVTYTIIQSIMRSEMCSLHLTHPSVHTWSSGQPTVQRPGSSRGLPVGAGIRTHNLGLPRVSSPTLYPLGQRLPNDCIWALFECWSSVYSTVVVRVHLFLSWWHFLYQGTPLGERGRKDPPLHPQKEERGCLHLQLRMDETQLSHCVLVQV